MRRGLLFRALPALMLVTVACSSSDEPPGDSGVDGADEQSDIVEAAVSWDEIDGLVAAAGPTGLRIITPAGAIVTELADGLLVRQPTWSRDASRLAATTIDPATGQVDIALVDTATWEMARAPAFRPYFFYTWSDDARLLAGLGPAGGLGGTAVDILDAEGMLVSNEAMVGGSMYVAWEPGGEDLLLHADNGMRLITDFDAVQEFVDFGASGATFQAASWIPGTRDFLFVDSTAVEPRLLRRDADSDETIDLGPAPGFTFVSVHPDGETAAMAFGSPTGDEPEVILASFQEPRTTAVEIVDLATGERTEVLDALGVWLEWSPDGSDLLIATPTPGGLSWRVFDGFEIRDLGTYTPTEAFRQRYVPFADQYTETPRLWSPDGNAIAFGALLDGEPTAVAVRVSDGEARQLGRAAVAFFSPVPPPG